MSLTRRRVYRDLYTLIETGATSHPRGLQTVIGPSELGTECVKCLASRLAGVNPPPTLAWLSVIGTAVHAQLAEWVEAAGPRWLSEHRVTVGEVAGTPVSGSCDAYDTATGTVCDFKVVGKTRIEKALRHGPGQQYRSQVHLYGRGMEAAGHTVKHVAIWFMPRNHPRLDMGYFWTEPYDRGLADAVLEAASIVAEDVAAHTEAGDLAEWLDSLPSDTACYTCHPR